MGLSDRVIRILATVVIAILYFTIRIGGTTAIILGALAVIFAATGFIGFCPLYLLFGITTKKTVNYETRN